MSNIYPAGDAQYSTNLGLALWGADEVVVENFLLIDAAVGSGSSVKVNGATVSNPNFNGTLPAAPGGNTNITFQVSGSSVSAYVPTAVAGVTSITGDSVVYNNAASTGAVTLSLIAQAANTVLAGPTSAGPTAPTFRALVAGDIPALAYIPTTVMTTLGDLIYGGASGVATRLAGQTTIIKEYLSQTGNGTISAAPVWAQINYADITGTTPTPPSGTVLWSALGNAGANLSLSNAAFTTTFNQTSAVAWLWANTTTGTAITTNASPLHELSAQYYTGSTTGTDLWTIGSSLAAGTNGASTLTFAHSGSSGNSPISIPPGSQSTASDWGLTFTGTSIGFSASGTTAALQTSTGFPTLNFINGVSNVGSITTSSGGPGLQAGTPNNYVYLFGNVTTGVGPVTYLLNQNSFIASNVVQVATQITQTVNQTSTAGYTGLKIAITETGTGSGAKRLLDCYAGSGGATSEFYVTNGGNVVMPIAGSVLDIGGTDTGISRISAGVIGVGTGAAASTAGTLALSRLNGYSADMSGSVSSAPTGVVATNVVVAVGAATATFTVSSTEGFTIGDTVTLSASGWSGGSGLASSTATVTTVTSTTSMILTRASGGPWVAGTYSAQTGTLTQTGGTSVSVIYATAYTSIPVVVVTPTSNAGAFYLSASSTSGFTITYANSGTQTFNYHVMGNPS